MPTEEAVNQNNFIYDKTIEITIDSSTISDIITEEFQGKLEAVIIEVKDQPINLGIYFYPQTDIQILEVQQLIGSEYCSVRTDTYSERYEKFNNSQDRFALNNKLYIQVEGKPGSKVILTFRISKS